MSIKCRHFLFVLIFFALVHSTGLKGQEQWCNMDHEEEVVQMFNEASVMLADSNAGAIPLLKKVVKEDTAYTAAWFKLGEAYYSKAILSQYDILLSSHTDFYFRKAEDCFLHSVQLCGEQNQHLAYFYLGEIYYLQEKYDMADFFIGVYEPFVSDNHLMKEKVVRYSKNCDQWRYWHNNPAQVTINALDNLNTSGDEFQPFITHGASTITFLKKQMVYKPNSMHKGSVCSFKEAFIDGVNTLEQPIYNNIFPLSHNVPSKYRLSTYSNHTFSNKAYASIQLIRSNGKVYDADCDICVVGPAWEEFSGTDTILNVSNAFDGEPTVSVNDDYMIFGSDRDGGFGGKDLYYSYRDSMGNWSKPQNMGSVINTINDERTPFLHYDGKTLYYSSNGRFGLGGHDIYKCHRLNDTLWTEPMNLGLPLNSEQDDLNFVMDARSTMAYFASDKLLGKGGWDIYSVLLPDSLCPEENIILNGKIIDETQKAALGVDFSLLDANTGMEMEVDFNEEEGRFSVILPNSSRNYLFRAIKDGYSFTDRFFSASQHHLMNYRTIRIYPITVGEVFELSELKFGKDSYLLKHSNTIILNNFAEFLSANASLHFKIYAYFDAGTKIKNDDDLSTLRAKQLYDYLIKRGIDQERMVFIGRRETAAYDDLSPIKFEIISK